MTGSRRFLARSASLRRLIRNRGAVLGLFVLLALGLASVVGPFFLPDPLLARPQDRLAGPSAAHFLGTDHIGRDLLARVLHGGRVSFLIAITTTVVSLIIAMPLGVGAGYYGRLVDEMLSRVFDVLLAFPALLLAIIVVAALGPSPLSLITAISIALLPRYGRLFRSGTLQVLEREYVQNAVALGYGDIRIIFKHILPNIIVPVLVIAAGNMGRIAVAEASLSFLGVGIQPPAPSWGNIISDSQQYLQYFPVFALAPAIALTLATAAFSFVGDGLRDALDVKEPTTSRI